MKTQAVSRYHQGFNCAQAILSTYGPELGIPVETALKLPLAFGGGMARTGETCGSVSGALMVIGLKYGSSDPKDKKARKKVYILSRKLIKQFKARNGSVSCRELLELNLNSIKGMILAERKKVLKTLCPKFVQDASEILDELLD